MLWQKFLVDFLFYKINVFLKTCIYNIMIKIYNNFVEQKNKQELQSPRFTIIIMSMYYEHLTL